MVRKRFSAMFVRRFQYFFCSLLCCLSLSPFSLESAEKLPDGRAIYRQLCVKCHGKSGEGVKGKYDDVLSGDWSIEKLSRYIDKNMPEDHPEKCDGADAEAVARYINDAFYSREARLRNHPPRVELVRLTNRQYVNTLADLIKTFTGDDKGAGKERGLRATYYHSRHFSSEKQFQERIDRHINFDPAKDIPDSHRNDTNEFSMQWRGSLIADETGDYEFIIKTPNGVRLWVNDDEEPLIDAWVASEDSNNQTAKIRLIGGRAYPIKLDSFKNTKDKKIFVVLEWKPPHGVQEIIPTRNLSTTRLSPTFVSTTRFPPDDSSVGYERGVAVSKAWDEATTQAAIEVSNYVAQHLDNLSKSKSEDADRRAKVEAFCSDFVATAFRRPLTAEQKRIFVSSQFKGAPKLEDAVKRVVLVTLKSPRFLYLGLEDEKPDDFVIASRLSFDLWDSLPNRDLTKLTAQGQLHTREQVNKQARRMLEDPRARAKVQYFFQHWLQINRVEDLAKDAALYPGFTSEIIADLRTSLNLFLEESVWNGSSDFRQLLLSDSLFVNDRLAKFYGVNTEANDDFVKVKFDDKQRAGVITHPYLLSAFSYQKSTSPIHRGVFLTRNIVGRALKSPPMAMTFKDSDFAPNLTMREKVAELTRSQSCQACHSVINPLGFSLENFDAVGRYRLNENERPINAASEYITDDGKTVHLSGPRDVAEFAIKSDRAQIGFIEQLFHSIVKQPALAYGPDVLNQLRQSFVASGFNMQKLLVEIATISAMHDVSGTTTLAKKEL